VPVRDVVPVIIDDDDDDDVVVGVDKARKCLVRHGWAGLG
jgi:hypothetical protein